MPISLPNFEESIDKETCERGYDFYCEGRIKNAFRINAFEWQALVQVFDDYNVSIRIQNNNMTKYTCNCEDAQGVCKHVAAVLYFIREEGEIAVAEDKAGFEEMKDSLNYLAPHVLRYLMLKYAANSKEFRKYLQDYFTSQK
jgi:uncharacterized Zn finger protein